MDIYSTVGLWIAAFGILACFSYAFKENIFFRIVQAIFVGCSIGYITTFAIDSITRSGLNVAMAGNYVYFLPIIIGFALFAKYSKKYYWISRYPLAILVGTGTGLAARAIVQVNIIAQIIGTIQINTTDPWAFANGIIIFVGVLTGMTYFLFTIKVKGRIFGGVTRFGRITLMVAFGTAFGSTFVGRFSLFIGSLQYLFINWLGLPGAVDYPSLIGAAVILLAICIACFQKEIFGKIRPNKKGP